MTSAAKKCDSKSWYHTFCDYIIIAVCVKERERDRVRKREREEIYKTNKGHKNYLEEPNIDHVFNKLNIFQH